MVERKRRVNVVLEGDSAALWDVCITKLGITEGSRAKGATDAKLLKLAIHALDKHIQDVALETGARFPDVRIVAEKAGFKQNL